MTSDTPSAARDKNRTATPIGGSVTLRGSVEKIISSLAKRGSDTVQIVVEDGEPLYREIRIRNLYRDANGDIITLRSGSEVEITIKVRAGK